MLVAVFAVLCILFFAAAVLQTIRLRALRQQMETQRQNAETEIRKRDTLWHELVHDLRNPAACVFSLAELIQKNHNNDPEQMTHFLDEMYHSSEQILNILAERVPPRLDTKAIFGTEKSAEKK